MGMKPRTTPEPIPVAAIGETPRGWQALHFYLHELEEVWEGLCDPDRDSFIKALALFLGGACSHAEAKQLALVNMQHLVRTGFVEYDRQRNDICQAVVTAHTFGRGDQTVN
jgi:hypothetical protein